MKRRQFLKSLLAMPIVATAAIKEIAEQKTVVEAPKEISIDFIAEWGVLGTYGAGLSLPSPIQLPAPPEE